MKKHLITLFFAVIIATLALNSCQKSYITGDVQNINQYSHMTSYAYLQSVPAFDTLVQCINAAGLKDSINAAGNTFFAPTNHTIYLYLLKRTLIVQNKINQYGKWGLDSLLYYITNNKNGTRDSLKMYLFRQKITYGSLTNIGKYYKSSLAKDSAIISYEETTDPNMGYSKNYSTIPKVLYMAHVFKPYTLGKETPSSSIPGTIGSRVICTSSGINTSNGVVHVLYTHSLFFNRFK